MDVYASLFFEYNTLEDLRSILLSEEFVHCEWFIHIGSGSNLLFGNDYKGIVMHSALRTLEVIDNTDDYVLVRVGAGYVWDDFVDYCVKQEWAGIENLSAIPGEVGASAVQNIGA